VNCLEVGAVVGNQNAPGFDSQFDDFVVGIAVTVF